MAEQLEIQNMGASTPTEPVGGSDEGYSLGELIGRYWELIKKLYWLLILLPVLTVTAAYFWTEEQPRVYESESKVVFHQSPENLFGEIQQVDVVNTGGRWGFESFWQTQRQVFKSQWFGERVVKREGLVDEQGLAPKDDSLSRDEKIRLTAKKVLGMVSFELEGDSRVVNVEAAADDPELSKLVANSMARQVVEYIEEQQSGGMQELVSWFDDYVAKKRTELEDTQRNLHRFKRDQNILSLSYENRTNLTAASMESIREQLLTVRGELFEKRALLSQVKSMEESAADSAETQAIADLVDNDRAKGLASSEGQLEQKLASLVLKYGEKHPKVRSARAELEVVRRHLDSEIRKIRKSIQNEVAVLERNEAQLENELDRLKSEVFELNELGLQYNQLKDRAENEKQLYNTVLKRSAELDINSMYDQDLAQVLEEAEIPSSPVSPNVPLNLAMGLALGIVLAGATVVVVDAMDTSIRSKDDVARYTRKPVLAMLPNVQKRALDGIDDSLGDSPLDTISFTAPKSSYAEGIKTLRTNLMFMAPDDPPKLLLVTSPGPGEGKTSTSMNMAIAMAQSGQKTLVVDSDLRRPRVHTAVGIEKENGLSSILVGKANFDDMVSETGIDNLDILTCGEIPPNPSELLHTDRFRSLIEELKEKYDRVIFDSPPLAAVSDALVLSHHMDSVVLILKFGQTKRELLRRSIEQLNAIGAPLMGCVLNDIAPTGSPYAYNYYYRYRYESDEEEMSSNRMAS